MNILPVHVSSKMRTYLSVYINIVTAHKKVRDAFSEFFRSCLLVAGICRQTRSKKKNCASLLTCIVNDNYCMYWYIYKKKIKIMRQTFAPTMHGTALL